AKEVGFAQINPLLAGPPGVAARIGALRRCIGIGSGKSFHLTTSIAVERVDMKPDFYKLLVEETPDGLIATSPDGKVLHWNRGAETTFGYSSAEAIGRSLNELIVPPDRLEEESAIQREALAVGVATYESYR